MSEISSDLSPAVQIRDLRIDYGSHVAVSDLTLDIPRGVIYGLVGPNGAGKTSTFKAITSLLQPTNGSISIAGHNVKQDSMMAQRCLGYMPDLAPVPSDLRVWEFLDFYASSHGLRNAEKTKRVNECLELVELSDKSRQLCTTLSRGMMQRLVLAKTLLHKPAVMVLDEPASGMDVRSRFQLKTILRRACSEGTTVLVSSHILPELSDMCHMIGILNKGQLLDSGLVNDVLGRMTGLLPHVEIRLASPHSSDWNDWISTHPQANDIVHLSSTATRFLFDGDDHSLSTFISQAIQAGHPICHLHKHQRSLENILLELEDDLPKSH